MVAANVYQTFARQVWEAIIDRTKEAEVQRLHQATQVAQMHDVFAFLGEANLARNQHLAVFQGNIEKWAADHQSKVNDLEKAARENQERVATWKDNWPRPRKKFER